MKNLSKYFQRHYLSDILINILLSFIKYQLNKTLKKHIDVEGLSHI